MLYGHTLWLNTRGRQVLGIRLFHFVVIAVFSLWLETSFLECFGRGIIDLDTPRAPTVVYDRRWVNLGIFIFILLLLIPIPILNTRGSRR